MPTCLFFKNVSLTTNLTESLHHSDPDSVVLCVLATDEEDEDDIALQIHFTLLQAFCCENDINILRVSGLRRLAQVIGEPSSKENNNNGEPRDFHCILVTVSVRSSAITCIIVISLMCSLNNEII